MATKIIVNIRLATVIAIILTSSTVTITRVTIILSLAINLPLAVIIKTKFDCLQVQSFLLIHPYGPTLIVKLIVITHSHCFLQLPFIVSFI